MSVKHIWFWTVLTFLFLFFLLTNSESENVRKALVTFMHKLEPPDQNFIWGWNLTSDPCTHNWHGVTCSANNQYIKSIVLEELNLTGVLDATSLCISTSLQFVSLNNNNLHGFISEDIRNCKFLTHLLLSGNKFSGSLPVSIPRLRNMKRLHVSDNHFTGDLPNMVNVTSLISFLAQNNYFTGQIPDFDFSNFEAFNVSNNDLRGPVPDVRGRFGADSFYGNPNLCGKPISNSSCPPPSPPPPSIVKKEKIINQFLDDLPIYSGYIVIGLILLIFLIYKLLIKCMTKDKEKGLDHVEKKDISQDTSVVVGGGEKLSEILNSNGSKNWFTGLGMRSEYSMTSMESGVTTSGLVLLSSRKLRGLQFEDLLSAPAELIRRGKHGSLYKVMLDNGVLLAVKRIKDWGISKHDFERRINLIAQVKHPLVMSPVAYYCSQQEKLLAYEYLPNGSLFMLLYAGSQSGHSLDWRSRLDVATKIADALAYLHEELSESGISHGNLKSSNILFDKNMNPQISEYGLMVSHIKSIKNRNMSSATFRADIYAFGVILLELLTGKVVKNDGLDLVKWVNSVISEEWTAEVFDRYLITQGASEERMVNLLQVALKCTNPSPNDKLTMRQVALITNALKDEDDKSISFDTSRV
ncbi:probable inactive receptor kinase At2g26730 [Trifolium pratense]|uniref:probable inactive receptor kinase At2g26730 n=1 Tax=Trifolium pratense TaxID=57577 RepID=UPI001E6977DA|nr:probable inactive receptor kinase At2g26730 [Trifolium pratense]